MTRPTATIWLRTNRCRTISRCARASATTLIPYLNAFAGGDIVSRFCDGAELASIEKSYLDGIAESVAAHAVTFAGDSCGSVDGDCELLRIDAKALAREPRAIRLRVIAHALAAVGVDPGDRHVDAVDRLISQWHGQGAVALPERSFSISSETRHSRVPRWSPCKSLMFKTRSTMS